MNILRNYFPKNKTDRRALLIGYIGILFLTFWAFYDFQIPTGISAIYSGIIIFPMPFLISIYLFYIIYKRL